MASIVYDDDQSDDFQISDTSIAASEDTEELLEWFADCEAAIASIKGQIEVAALGANADPDWVYRASKAAGFYRMAQARLTTRLGVLGASPPDTVRRVRELNTELTRLRADAAICREMVRIAREGAMPSHEFARLEQAALDHLAAVRAGRQAKAARQKLAIEEAA